mmetsp:Transcript_145941/g.466384  ORF Transcript_145941/g.466384 Transcript_145941/m.466384 type:complete len:112 (+) Transcript_145941:1347-1682(+)
MGVDLARRPLVHFWGWSIMQDRLQGLEGQRALSQKERLQRSFARAVRMVCKACRRLDIERQRSAASAAKSERKRQDEYVRWQRQNWRRLTMADILHAAESEGGASGRAHCS